MNKVKYIRCSTEEQNTSRQETNLKNFSKIYIDRCSGAIKLGERKEGKRLLRDIESGIVTEVHVASIDRLGRNLIDTLTMIKYFNDKSINLFVENIGMYSLIKGKPNSSFNIIVSVLSNVSEMELEFIKERQKQGILAAKARGIYKGRLYGSKMADNDFLEKYRKVVKELKSGQSLRRAAALGECSLGTAQRVQKILSTAA
jgi:DNA invertase Pin-like site-specific DNA recombinase